NAIVSHTNHCFRLTFIAIVPPAQSPLLGYPPSRHSTPGDDRGQPAHLLSSTSSGAEAHRSGTTLDEHNHTAQLFPRWWQTETAGQRPFRTAVGAGWAASGPSVDGKAGSGATVWIRRSAARNSFATASYTGFQPFRRPPVAR